MNEWPLLDVSLKLIAMKIILGITGGIAAYKAPDLVRKLIKNKHAVQVVMTQSAHEFVAPLALQTVSGQAVRSHLFDPQAESAMDHIELARWADLILIAPATAHCIAQLAHGLASDLLTTLCLASSSNISLAPAMNQQMWHQAITQQNIATLTERGVFMIGPAQGDQACGETGFGRMVEPDEIANIIEAQYTQAC